MYNSDESESDGPDEELIYNSDAEVVQVKKKDKMDPKKRYINDALHYAVQTNNRDGAKMLLNQCADPEWECKISGLTPLQSCVCLDHMDMFRLLLDKGADAGLFLKSTENFYELEHLVLQKRTDILVRIFDHVVKPGNASAVSSWGHLVKTLTSQWKDPSVNYLELFKVLLSCKFDQGSKESVATSEILDGVSFRRIARDVSHGQDLPELMLFSAIEASSKECVQYLIDSGVKVNLCLPWGVNTRIPLHCACSHRNLDIVKLLVDCGAEHVKNPKGDTPLDISYKKGCVDIVKFLMSKGYSSEKLDEYNLHLACLLGDEEQVTACLNGGADVNGKDFNYKTPLQLCIQGKTIPVLTMLLRCPNLNAHGERKKNESYWDFSHRDLEQCPIYRAIDSRDVKVVTTVLDSLLGKKSLRAYCSYSHELLVRSIQNNDEDVFKLLLERGADVTCREEGTYRNGAIQCAAEIGNLFMLKELVKRGVDVNSNPADDGREGRFGYDMFDAGRLQDMRPLYICRDAKCIRYLLEKGASFHSLEAEKSGLSLGSLLGANLGFGHTAFTGLQKAKINPDLDRNGDPFPTYIKIIESGNIDAMKVYFEMLGPALRTNEYIFHFSCLNGQFDLVRYLATQNSGWLSRLADLDMMFDEKDVLWEEKRYKLRNDVVEYHTSHHVKMADLLFQLGCTLNPNALNRFLGLTYVSQRYLFSRFLQELCGRTLYRRNLRIDIDEYLKTMMKNGDHEMILHLLNCGHMIEVWPGGERLRQWRDRYEKPQHQKFLSFVDDVSHQPVGLQSLCRVKVRSTLFKRMKPGCHINQLIRELPLPESMKGYVGFTGQFEHSYLRYTYQE